MSTKENFNNILQSKFKNWEHPVDEANWSEMRKNLKTARKIEMRFKLAVAGSVLVIAAGIGAYTLLNSNAAKNGAAKPSSTSNVINRASAIAAPGVNSPAAVASLQPITAENNSANQNRVSDKNPNSTVRPDNNTGEVTSTAALENINNVPSGNNQNPETSNISPTIIDITGAHTICSGSFVTLSCNITGGKGELSYTWQPGNLTGKSITVSPTATTVYTLTVGGVSGITTATTTVMVNASPQVAFTSDVQKGCSPVTVQFKDLSVVSSGTPTSWTWNFGNGDMANAQNPVYTYNNPGTYNVNLTVVSSNGCSSTLNIPNMVSVYSHPKASFTLSNQLTTTAGTVVQFRDGSTDSYGISNWSWSFYDGSDNNTSNMQNPSHTYSDTGRFCTRLIVTDVNGCVDSVTNCLDIAPVFNVYIPSAFSPNGDHKNDVFQPKAQYMTSFEMYIFNGQGSEIYHAVNRGWDGTANGGSKVCQEGVYQYKIIVLDAQNMSHTKIGSVTLIK